MEAHAGGGFVECRRCSSAVGFEHLLHACLALGWHWETVFDKADVVPALRSLWCSKCDSR